MTNTCRYYSLFLLLLAVFQVQAQSTVDGNLPKLIPPSPNAASLGIYGDIPVSKYTGVPSTTIPLYTLTAGPLSLPINLNYHASGIKVAQEASWVGLGWSLDAGGVISRSIVGVDDFSVYPLGYYANPTYPTCANGYCDVSVNATNNYWTEVHQGRQDTGPDQFYYNLGGYSGKMVYVPSKQEFVSLKADNIRIRYTADRWVLTTPDGIRYIFSTPEKTTSYSRSEVVEVPNLNDITNWPGSVPQTTSWYLDSIVSPTKEYIALRYKTSNYQTPSVVYQSRSFRWLREFYVPLCPGGTTGPSDIKVNQQFTTFGYSQSVVQDKYLQEIEGSNGIKISFITDDRADLKQSIYTAVAKPQKLVKLSISSPGTQQTIEHYFTYSHFPSVPHQATDDYKYLRLRLDQVQTKSNGPGEQQQKPPYKFAYNNGVLPAKNSFNIDHWGYYNQNITNNDICPSNWVDTNNSNPTGTGTLIPTYTFNYVSAGTSPTIYMQGAERTPNPQTAQYGMLTGITYPTGGTTAFTYESNGYHGGWVDVVSNRTSWATLNGSTPASESSARTFSSPTITIPAGKRIFLSTYSYPIPGGNPNAPVTYTTYCDNGIQKYAGGNMGSNPLLCYAAPMSQYATYKHFQYNDWDLPCNASATTLIKKEIGLFSSPTSYQLVLTPAPGFLAVALITTEEVSSVYQEAVAGGVRIKQIASSTGQQTLTKSYSYTQPMTTSSNAPAISSGVLLAPISYFYTAIPYGSGYNLGGLNFVLSSSLEQNNMLVANSSSCLPMSVSSGGSSVGYSQVTETSETQGVAAGKTVETYVNEAELASNPGASPFLFPGVPNQAKNANGLVKSTCIYAADGSLLKTVTNEYTVSADATSTSRLYITYGSLPGTNCPNPMFIRYYDYVSEWWRKISETTKTYATDHSLKDGLQSFTTYKYDVTNRLVNEQTTTTSTGDSLKTKTAFAHNNPSETQMPLAILTALTGRYMIGLPIKQETFRGNRRIQAKITNYNMRLLPASLQLLEGSQLPVRVLYDTYDAQGHLTQYHVRSGPATAILWGYPNAQPVIEAKNITYSTLTTAVGQVLQQLGYSTGMTSWNQFLSTGVGQASATQRAWLRQFTDLLQRHPSLQQAQLTFRTYDPLFGEQSSTDPTGRTAFYEYDNLGRLQRTRDEQGRILSQQQYHYVGQP